MDHARRPERRRTGGTWKGPPNEIEAELGRAQPDEARIDICAFPFLKYATLDDPEDDELFHTILRERQRDGHDRPALAAWIDRVDTLPRA